MAKTINARKALLDFLCVSSRWLPRVEFSPAAPDRSDNHGSDMVDPVMDEQLAMFVVESHCRSHPSNVQAASKTGGGSQEAEDDNTQIINDKVREFVASAAAAFAAVGKPTGVRTGHTWFRGGVYSCQASP